MASSPVRSQTRRLRPGTEMDTSSQFSSDHVSSELHVEDEFEREDADILRRMDDELEDDEGEDLFRDGMEQYVLLSCSKS